MGKRQLILPPPGKIVEPLLSYDQDGNWLLHTPTESLPLLNFRKKIMVKKDFNGILLVYNTVAYHRPDIHKHFIEIPHDQVVAIPAITSIMTDVLDDLELRGIFRASAEYYHNTHEHIAIQMVSLYSKFAFVLLPKLGVLSPSGKSLTQKNSEIYDLQKPILDMIFAKMKEVEGVDVTTALLTNIATLYNASPATKNSKLLIEAGYSTGLSAAARIFEEFRTDWLSIKMELMNDPHRELAYAVRRKLLYLAKSLPVNYQAITPDDDGGEPVSEQELLRNYHQQYRGIATGVTFRNIAREIYLHRELFSICDHILYSTPVGFSKAEPFAHSMFRHYPSAAHRLILSVFFKCFVNEKRIGELQWELWKDMCWATYRWFTNNGLTELAKLMTSLPDPDGPSYVVKPYELEVILGELESLEHPIDDQTFLSRTKPLTLPFITQELTDSLNIATASVKGSALPLFELIKLLKLQEDGECLWTWKNIEEDGNDE